MITVVIRAMWDAVRILILAAVCGLAVATWALVCMGILTGGM